MPLFFEKIPKIPKFVTPSPDFGAELEGSRFEKYEIPLTPEGQFEIMSSEKGVGAHSTYSHYRSSVSQSTRFLPTLGMTNRDNV